MNTMNDQFMTFLANAPHNFAASVQILPLIVKVTLLLLAAASLSGAMYRASAAARHLVWAASIAAILALPFFSYSLPTWKIVVARPVQQIALPLDPAKITPNIPGSQVPAATSKRSIPTPAVASAHYDAEPPQTALARELTWIARVMVVWLCGVLWMLVRTLSGHWRLQQSDNRSAALDNHLLDLAKECAAAMGIRRRIHVRRAADCQDFVVPVTWGAFRPVVLLPYQSLEWTEECVRAALLHEFAHIRRWDWLTQTVGSAACAIFWFHPLVWIAARQMRENSERACDDCVIRAGVAPTDYAQRLVDVLRSIPDGAKAHRTIAIAMALPNETVGRMRAILARGLDRRGASRNWAIGGALLTLGLILPAAALRVARPANEEVVYANGVRMSLVGISRADVGFSSHVKTGVIDAASVGAERPWWSVTGARIPEDQQTDPLMAEPRFHVTYKPPKDIVERVLVFRATGIPPQSTFDLNIDGIAVSSYGAVPEQGADRSIKFTVALNGNRDYSNIHIGIAGQAWKTIAEIPTSNGETHIQTPWGAATVRVMQYSSELSGAPGKFGPEEQGIDIAGRVANGEMRLLGIDRNGKTFMAKSNGVGYMPQGSVGLNGLFDTPTPPRKSFMNVKFDHTQGNAIQQYIVQARPYEWREFHDVPMDPRR